jgi:hypothetical protein
MRNNCEQTKIKDWPEGLGDGFNYKIDLGNPLISLSNKDILEETTLTEKKNLLRRVVDLEQQNILYRKQHVRAFAEIKINDTNVSNFVTGAKFEGRNTDDPNDIYNAIREALIVQLFVLNAHGNKKEQEAIKELLKAVPYTWYYKDLHNFEEGKEFFDWIDPSKL